MHPEFEIRDQICSSDFSVFRHLFPPNDSSSPLDLYCQRQELGILSNANVQHYPSNDYTPFNRGTSRPRNHNTRLCHPRELERTFLGDPRRRAIFLAGGYGVAAVPPIELVAD